MLPLTLIGRVSPWVTLPAMAVKSSSAGLPLTVAELVLSMPAKVTRVIGSTPFGNVTLQYGAGNGAVPVVKLRTAE